MTTGTIWLYMIMAGLVGALIGYNICQTQYDYATTQWRLYVALRGVATMIW